MAKFFGATRALRTAVAAMLILAAGCGSSAQQAGAGGVVNIDPKLLLASIGTGIQQPVARALGGWEWGSFLRNFSSLLTGLRLIKVLPWVV